LSIDRARSLVHGVASLPVMPAHADELLRVATAGDPEPASLLAIVERDPVLAAMVLRLVNSAAYGFRREIGDLSHAVVLLGVPELRTLALAASMAALFSPGNDEGDGLPGWDHAFATACTARSLAEELAPGREEPAFAAGMLHDIGHLVIESSLDNADPVVLGVDHAELGAALAERWKIPAHLVDAVAAHHTPTMDTARPDLATLVFAAEVLCDSFLPPVDGGGLDALLVLQGLGAVRPEAMALRVRDDVLATLTIHDVVLERS
jgi:putative nucleotidyltransferase with HDIG domain